MTTPADRTIAALRATHYELAGVVSRLPADQLTDPSAASEWTIAQVLSHLGSGAEITLATLRGATGEAAAPGEGFNQGVWDRWNAMSPQEQAAGYLEHDAAIVAAFEALTAAQHESVQVEMGFLPFPLSLAGFGGMRLNEAALHSWDVRVALDPSAVIAETTATVLAEHLSGELGFLLGFIGKADTLTAAATVAIEHTGLGVVIADSVSLESPATDATATFHGPVESAVRLLSGRLTAQYTAAGTSVSGNVTLDDLRTVFPGY